MHESVLNIIFFFSINFGIWLYEIKVNKWNVYKSEDGLTEQRNKQTWLSPNFTDKGQNYCISKHFTILNLIDLILYLNQR